MPVPFYVVDGPSDSFRAILQHPDADVAVVAQEPTHALAARELTWAAGVVVVDGPVPTTPGFSGAAYGTTSTLRCKPGIPLLDSQAVSLDPLALVVPVDATQRLALSVVLAGALLVL